MSDEQPPRRTVQVIHRSSPELEAEIARLRSLLVNCYSSECPCHQPLWDELRSALFLLGGHRQQDAR